MSTAPEIESASQLTDAGCKESLSCWVWVVASGSVPRSLNQLAASAVLALPSAMVAAAMVAESRFKLGIE
ncbi:MAG TPA: hypothetical protein ENI80_04750 [Acidiferrobacteraceae bacterium]|nr:hypothetical protein [Acidiferrobacteraceae bacterium]